MASKKKTIAALSAGLAVAASVGGLLRTRRLQNEARAAGTHVPNGPYEAVVKRPLDCIIAAVSLVALSPIMAVTAIAVHKKLGSPVIFSQKRPGLNGEPFEIYKFRTMSDERNPETGELLPDTQRLRPFGIWLRSSSLDELPELLNILNGDMALIGPRPLLMRYLSAYTNEERHRHDVRPGLSGLAQIKGRNYIPWDERLAYDVQYSREITFLGDTKIVFQTILKVLSNSDVAANTEEVNEGYLDEIRLAKEGRFGDA